MTDSAAVSIDSVSLGAEVKALAEHVRELRERIAASADQARGPLLDELCTLDDAARDLRDARDAVLVQVRVRGVSWNSISTKTGVPATTWRGRHDRYLEGDQP
ncbi:hypothetical protein [Actinophytocola sp.]|uniref:hypothetical protein n=1 Tax=Actinophytocola sp. TaxID=1872138 RepID=UPI002D810975|nr:hypothetical protein [Actinophytocola sp.]HET9144181.1 hypothetical protein [Actinophytocola sp.]